MHPDVRSILESTRQRAESAETNVENVDARDFVGAVRGRRREGKTPVVAEIKPTSPTTEGVKHDDPVDVARRMVDGGAVALSVLTEPHHFGGSLETLERVRSTVEVPVLRKDFVVEPRQIREAEADLILIIARFADDLAPLVDEALSAGFEPLVEVHTRDELDDALDTDARVIGVNSRDLTRLEVDLSVPDDLLPLIPDDRLAVAESGISSPEDVRRMLEAGADALLVGTAIMRSDDVEARTRELVETQV